MVYITTGEPLVGWAEPSECLERELRGEPSVPGVTSSPLAESAWVPWASHCKSLTAAVSWRGMGVTRWHLKSLKGEDLLFWDLLLGLQASGLTHPMRTGHKPRSNWKTLGSHTLPLAVPAQPAGGQPDLTRQAEPHPGSQDLFAIIKVFFFPHQSKYAFLS